MVQDSCQCSYSLSEVDSELFHCFDRSEESVAYRARLVATAEVDTESIVSSLEEWAADRNIIVMGGVLLTAESGCEISDLMQEEGVCAAKAGSNSKANSTKISTAVMAGAVVGGAVVVMVMQL